MSKWRLTLHGADGVLDRLESGETEFVLGSEEGTGVLCVAGLAPRHARVSILAGGMEVEDLGAGVMVDGKAVPGRMRLGYPACVQFGSVTLMVETLESARPQGLEATVPQLIPVDSGWTLAEEIPVTGFQEMGRGPFSAETTCRYTLVQEIARGGMGQIYLGEDLQLSREVAVKVSSLAQGGMDPRFAR